VAGLAGMHPAYLAMSTGIVSIAAHLLGLSELASALLWVNIVAYPALWVLLGVRLIRYPRRVLADCRSHQRAPGFFTVVAATGVIGTQIVVLEGGIGVARAMWWVTLALWVACTYTVFGALAVRRQKPSLAEGINGGWLVAVVATQSVVVLGCSASVDVGGRDASLLVLMCFWLFGGMLYFWTIALIFYRYMFFPFTPGDLMPPYWINMGAMAISTVAGVLLAESLPGSPTLEPMAPFVTGLTLMFWATATWWIPLLLILGLWRHVVRRLQLRYDPLYWGLVFPLGMYATCTFRLSELLEVPFLWWIAAGFVVGATTAWLLAFLGTARVVLEALLRWVRRPMAARRVERVSADAWWTGGTQG